MVLVNPNVEREKALQAGGGAKKSRINYSFPSNTCIYNETKVSVKVFHFFEYILASDTVAFVKSN